MEQPSVTVRLLARGMALLRDTLAFPSDKRCYSSESKDMGGEMVAVSGHGRDARSFVVRLDCFAAEAFRLTEPEIRDVVNGFLPEPAASAVRRMAMAVDARAKGASAMASAPWRQSGPAKNISPGYQSVTDPVSGLSLNILPTPDGFVFSMLLGVKHD